VYRLGDFVVAVGKHGTKLFLSEVVLCCCLH